MTDQTVLVDLLRQLAAGASLDDLRRRHPSLTAEGLRAAFGQAAELLGGPAPEAATRPPRAEPAQETATVPPAGGDEFETVLPVEGEPTASRQALVPGYEVLGELGRGGMGVVYKARHLKLNRIVALKMILAGDHASPETRARFEREAEAVAALQHPNVVQVFEVGEHQGHSYLALELVPGGSLAARLTAEPWPGEDAAALVEKLARAVEAAHRRGIVHRDLKPENVLLTEDGEPKVTDFGLAKRLDDATGRTKTGEVMGTPNYMAPEQAAGRKDVGPAADVYALGGILHRLLSGKVPFDGPTSLDVLMRVIDDEPVPLRKLNPAAPRDLETVVLKCLHKEAAKRYASAGDLADDLRRYREGEPIRARRVSWRESASRWMLKNRWLFILRSSVGVISFNIVLTFFIFHRDASGVGAVFLILVTLTAFLRARPRPLLVGGLASACLIGLVGALIAGNAAEGILSWVGSEGTQTEVAVGLCAAVLLIGPMIGALFTERWSVLLIGAVVLGTGLAFTLARPPGVAFAAIAGAVYIGLVTRLAHWYRSGPLIDMASGCVFGTALGCLAGASWAGLLSKDRAQLLGTSGLSPQLLLSLAFVGVCTVGGGWIGALFASPRIGRTGPG